MDPCGGAGRAEVRGRLAHWRAGLRHGVLVWRGHLPLQDRRRRDPLRGPHARGVAGLDVEDKGGADGVCPQRPAALLQQALLRCAHQELQPLLERGGAVPAEREAAGPLHPAAAGVGSECGARQDAPPDLQQGARLLRPEWQARRLCRRLCRRPDGRVAEPHSAGRRGLAPRALHRPAARRAGGAAVPLELRPGARGAPHVRLLVPRGCPAGAP
mmetsp:Transcript_96188/g.287103  ORF Transcript_96188/g.287103 Transcript_96188/m.287103 type:complete len:214 (-) Transcript_96188:643-1284(-)